MKKLKIVMIAAAALSMSLAANAQNKYGETPDDSIACISNVSLYQEFYKQKAYTDCYEPWRQIIKHCPRFSKGVYQRGEKIMDAMIKAAATDEEREAYIQELMAMYDTRIANFGEEAKVLCMKATTLSEYKPQAVKEIYEIYDAAVKAGVGGQQATREAQPHLAVRYGEQVHVRVTVVSLDGQVAALVEQGQGRRHGLRGDVERLDGLFHVLQGSDVGAV